MTKKLFLLPFLCLTGLLHAQNISSKIEKVTVFLSGAQVTRSATVLLKAGKHDYVFTDLSPKLIQSTLQVSGKGDFTLLSAVQRINYLQEKQAEYSNQLLQARMDSLKEKMEAEQIGLEVWKSEEDLLEKLQIISQNQKLPSSEEITEAMSYREKRLIELKMKALQSNKKLSKWQESYKQFYKQMKEEEIKQSKNTSEVTLTILAKNDLSASLTMSYFVAEAGWEPFYDFRVKDISLPMTVAHKANVFQQTGEDWKEVKLILSNANPYQDNRLPNLNAWQLWAYDKTLVDREPDTPEGELVDNKGRTLDSDEDGVPDTGDEQRFTPKGCDVDNRGVALDGDNDHVPDCLDYELNSPANESVDSKGRSINKKNLNFVTTEMLKNQIDMRLQGQTKTEENIPLLMHETHQATVFSYEIAEPYTILADAKMNMVEIKSIDIPVQYQYFAIPKVQANAYLLALIRDWEKYNFLEGDANLFFEDTYIGKSRLNLDNAGDTLRISLGQDKQVLVSRTRLKEDNSKQNFGNMQYTSRSFEISVRNTKKEAINMLIEDQFPLIANKEVILEKIAYKDAKLNEETGKVYWTLTIVPAEDRKLNLKYGVKYPKNWVVDLE
jgi:Domain of unknown function (DUF4139)/N-terminal domain of unknown function (DUF4140)